MTFRRIFRYDPDNQLLRLLRMTWQRETVGDGKGYSAKFTLGLRPCLFSFRREYGGWLLTILGLRLHYDRSFGGIHGA